MTYKILVFSSNPTDTQQLGLNKEFRQIEEARKDSQNKHQFSVLRVPAAGIDDLAREILEDKPRIIHFCGHGLGNQGLVLETRSGEKELISNQALADLFELLANQVECVILNACYSQTQAAEIHQHINYVIGTKNAIKDDAAIAFSLGFYEALFAKESIERAYEFGKSKIQQKYNQSKERKLVPVDKPEKKLPEKEVFTYLVKDPPNKITGLESSQEKENIPSNLNQRGSANFVGQEKQLEELHELIQQNEKVTISAIAGMGGIGKTELALQYANRYQEHYTGGLCWFSVRSENLGTQIVEFARTYLEISVPEELETDLAKVKHCWQKWNSKPSLVVLDDVINYGRFYRDSIKPYLPPVTNQVKVLMTSREKPGKSLPSVDLNVLSEGTALQFLKSLIRESRVENELGTVKQLCEWLGYLPLGLELVGRYIDLDDNLTIEKTLQRLKRREINARALLASDQADMNAQLGVAAAFDLSWDILTPEAQELGCYLSLFDSEPFKWSWVTTALIEAEDEDEKEDLIEELESLRNRQLTKRNLLNSVRESPDSTKYNYQLHSLIAQYFRAKLDAKENATELKKKFCRAIKQVAQSIDDSPTLKEIQTFSIAIPHLSYVAQELTGFVSDENLIWSYLGLGRYYSGQGIYNRAVQWYEECLIICRERLGEEHLDVAQSLNNLALLYYAQGRYEDAEPLYLKALELRQKLLGEEHPDVAQSLNNLALLYYAQGRYEDAEPLYLKALEIAEIALGKIHPSTKTIRENLAYLQNQQK